MEKIPYTPVINARIGCLGKRGVGINDRFPRKALIKWHFGNAQLFRLARHELFLKQEWTLLSSTVSKKGK